MQLWKWKSPWTQLPVISLISFVSIGRFLFSTNYRDQVTGCPSECSTQLRCTSSKMLSRQKPGNSVHNQLVKIKSLWCNKMTQLWWKWCEKKTTPLSAAKETAASSHMSFNWITWHLILTYVQSCYTIETLFLLIGCQNFQFFVLTTFYLMYIVIVLNTQRDNLSLGLGN